MNRQQKTFLGWLAVIAAGAGALAYIGYSPCAIPFIVAFFPISDWGIKRLHDLCYELENKIPTWLLFIIGFGGFLAVSCLIALALFYIHGFVCIGAESWPFKFETL